MQQPQENIQLFFNNGKGKEDMKMIDNNVYKDYIITQNKNLSEENKKLILEKMEVEQKYEELDEETGTVEKRLSNTKNYLKNFLTQIYSQKKKNYKYSLTTLNL